MSKSKQPGENGRREFLRRVAVAGGSAAVVAAAGKTVAAPVEPEQKKPTREAVGYRETDHVRTYYSTCRN